MEDSMTTKMPPVPDQQRSPQPAGSAPDRLKDTQKPHDRQEDPKGTVGNRENFEQNTSNVQHKR
jgi:hypothetical protein